jgi:uncharacterized membrane protein
MNNIRGPGQRIVSETRVMTAASGFNSMRSSTDRLSAGTGLRTKIAANAHQKNPSSFQASTVSHEPHVRDIRDATTAKEVRDIMEQIKSKYRNSNPLTQRDSLRL